jgi:phosphoglycolate phosphatase
VTEPTALTQVRGVVLDLDGTLVDTIDDVAAALTGALEAVGLPGVGAAEVAPAMGHGSVDLVLSVLRGLDPGRSEDDEAIAAIHDDYRTRYAARPAELSTVFADGASALPALRRAGVRVGVCTNKSTDLANAVLSSVGLADAVEVVLGRDSVPHPKPDPRHLLAVLERLDLAPEETVYVGDNRRRRRRAGRRRHLPARRLGRAGRSGGPSPHALRRPRPGRRARSRIPYRHTIQGELTWHR